MILNKRNKNITHVTLITLYAAILLSGSAYFLWKISGPSEIKRSYVVSYPQVGFEFIRSH